MEFIISLHEGIIMVGIRLYLKYTFSHLILTRFNLEPVKKTTTFNNIINFFPEVRNCIGFKLQKSFIVLKPQICSQVCYPPGVHLSHEMPSLQFFLHSSCAVKRRKCDQPLPQVGPNSARASRVTSGPLHL